MTRIRCTNHKSNGICKNIFRSRKPHEMCRSCYREVYGKSRPIGNRELSENKYRRNRKRRGVTTRVVPKVISNRNNIRGNNAISK